MSELKIIRSIFIDGGVDCCTQTPFKNLVIRVGSLKELQDVGHTACVTHVYDLLQSTTDDLNDAFKKDMVGISEFDYFLSDIKKVEDQ